MNLPVNTTLESALRMLPNADGIFFEVLMKGSGIEVDVYAPQKVDLQTPHDRDEIYFVARGEGEFVVDDERVTFGPGDMLFVEAHREHRFENFTDDFATWVLFYGDVKPSG